MSSTPVKKFADRLEDLRRSSALEAEGVLSWWYALDSDSESGYLNPFDKVAFASAFDRSEANKQYVDAVQAEGTSYREMQSAKVQGDVLSSLERDLSMRYRGRVRMLAHSHARLQTHGLNNGPINGGIVNFVKLLMSRGEQ